MEPHSYECGNPGVAVTVTGTNLASMEPHSYECGNGKELNAKYYKDMVLQWSRTLTSAEIFKSRPDGKPGKKLQWSRTLTSAEINCQARQSPSDDHASMEPHSYECGNQNGKVYGCKATHMLQWSRTLTSAEIAHWDLDLHFFRVLQWSRTLTSAEISDSLLGDTASFGLQWSRTLTSAEMS